jgi:hypothetical protein
MTSHLKLLGALTASGLLALSVLPASALTAQECSAKYQAAKSAGTLNGQKWNDFRKAECGAGATAATATTPAAAPAAAPATRSAPAPKTAAAPAAPVGNAVFPSAVDPKFANEKPGLAREHTCSQQWKANKAAGTTGGLKWNQKGGGGYYSECNKRLKGV